MSTKRASIIWPARIFSQGKSAANTHTKKVKKKKTKQSHEIINWLFLILITYIQKIVASALCFR